MVDWWWGFLSGGVWGCFCLEVSVWRGLCLFRRGLCLDGGLEGFCLGVSGSLCLGGLCPEGVSVWKGSLSGGGLCLQEGSPYPTHSGGQTKASENITFPCGRLKIASYSSNSTKSDSDWMSLAALLVTCICFVWCFYFQVVIQKCKIPSSK